MSTEDLAQIEAIANISFPTPWSVKTFRREIEKNEHGYYWVLAVESPMILTQVIQERDGPSKTQTTKQQSQPAQENSSILAYGGYWLLGEDAHIVTVATHPQYRQRGAAKLLLLYLLEAAAGAGVKTISLEVRESNIPAIKLYAGLGFKEEGRRKEYYSTDKNSSAKEDALILTLNDLQSAREALTIEPQHALVNLGINS